MGRSAALLLTTAAALLVVLGSSAAGATGEFVDEVHYTLTGKDSVAFTWRGTATEIRYGTTADYDRSATATAPEPLPWSSNGPFREAVLTGLTAGTTYHYSIGGGPDHTFRTTPAGPFRFDVQADVGTSSDIAMATTQTDIASDDPAFVLVPGDISYGDEASTVERGKAAVDRHFNDVMTWSRGAAYMPTWGNHEWDDPPSPNDDLRNYKGRFALPNAQASVGAPALGCCGEDWYWFDAGGVRFIAYPEPYPGAWTQWRVNADPVFAAAQADESVRFIVTYGHRPAYSTGFHDADDTGANSMGRILNQFGDRYSKYVLNLNGHSHNYERFQPIHGVTHVTSGGGGAGLEATWSTFDARTRVLAFHLQRLRVDVDAHALRVQAVCGAATGRDDTACPRGSVLDEYTIPAGQRAPEIHLTSPAAGGVVSAASPTIRGTAGTLGAADEPAVRVEIHRGTDTSGLPVHAAPATVLANGTWSLTTPAPLSDDTYTVVTRQTSTNGTGVSAPRTFEVRAAAPDTTAPVSSADTVTQPAPGSLSVPFDAADAGGSGLASVQLYVRPPGAEFYALADTSTAGAGTMTYSAATAGLGNGSYSLYTVAADRAGNAEQPPGEPDVTAVVTLPVPAAPALASPPAGTSYSTSDRMHLSGTAVPASQVTIFDNSSTVVTSVPARADGSWSATVVNVADGSHRYTTRATTAAHNTSGSSAGRIVIVDTRAPVSRAEAPGYSTGGPAAVSFTAADDAPSSGLAAVELWARTPGALGFTLVASQTSAAAGSFPYALTAGPGRYEFYTVAVDQAGNREPVPPAPTASTTLDGTPPAVTVTAPAAYAGARPTFAGAAGSAPGDDPTVTVDIRSGTTTVQTLTATAAAGEWTVAASAALPDGPYTVVARQTDAAGNTGTSAPRDFAVDTQPPAVSLSHPAGAAVTRDATPVFAGSAGSAPGDAATVSVTVVRGTGGPHAATLTAIRGLDGAWSVEPATALDDGVYTAVAEQRDAAGNAGTSTPATFTVDATAPAVGVTAPAAGAATNDATPRIAGTAADSTPVTIAIDGAGQRTLTATPDAGGTWTVDVSAPLADGEYTVRARQTDPAGNVGTSAPVVFNVDTVAPVLTLEEPAAGVTNDATPTLAGLAGTASGDEAAVTVRLYVGPVVVETLTAPRTADGRWRATATRALRDGPTTIVAQQHDRAGNAARSPARTLTVDTVKPSTWATAASTATPGRIVVAFRGGEAGLEAVELYARPPGAAAFALAGRAAPGAETGSFAFTTGGDGEYAFYTVGTDHAGNREDAPALPDVTATITTRSEGGPAPGPGVQSRPAPFAFALHAPSRLRAARAAKRGVRVSLTCSARCDWALTLRLASRTARKLGLTRAKRPYTLARAGGRLSASGTAPARLALSRRAAKRLRTLRRVSLKLEARVTDERGALRRAARTIVLQG